MAAEIIREKCFLILHHEIPYSLAIKIHEFDESKPKIVKIIADIYVSKPSHKPIVVGKAAATLKQIGMQSRRDLENLLGQKVFLKLEVIVKEEWASNQQLMQELGYHVARN